MKGVAKKDMARWRGVVALVRDSVDQGSRAIERVQIETARRPFVVLEHIPPIAAASRVVHVVHDACVTGVHRTIRGVNTMVGETVDFVLDQTR